VAGAIPLLMRAQPMGSTCFGGNVGLHWRQLKRSLVENHVWTVSTQRVCMRVCI
jgi:hypothetical protein